MRWPLLLALFALGLAAATFAARGGSARTTDGTLSASVGPGFSISLTQGGSAVTSLTPGTYTVNVSDMSTFHNFHLSGPGVDQATVIDTTSSATWTVTLSDGSYHFQCDAHPTMLHGDFTVGAGGGTTTAPTMTTGTTTTLPGTTTMPGTTTQGGSTTTTTTATTPETTTVPPATTTAAATTVSITPTGSKPAAKLSARVAKVTATRSRISVAVTVNRPGVAVADLLDQTGRRAAHATVRVRGTTKLTLHPAHTLRPGRYVLRLRVTAAGRAVVTTQSVHVA